MKILQWVLGFLLIGSMLWMSFALACKFVVGMPVSWWPVVSLGITGLGYWGFEYYTKRE